MHKQLVGGRKVRVVQTNKQFAKAGSGLPKVWLTQPWSATGRSLHRHWLITIRRHCQSRVLDASCRPTVPSSTHSLRFYSLCIFVPLRSSINHATLTLDLSN